MAMVALPEAVAAHRPVFPGERGASPETAVRIADPAVSHVVYAELSSEEPYVWFVFDNDLPRRIPIQLGTPAGVERADRDGADPIVLLFHPGTAESLHPRPMVPADSNTHGVTVIRRRSDAEFFDEPVTGTRSWILVDTEVSLPEAGTYYGVVYDQSERGGKFWIAVGQRERFSGRDVWRLPDLIRDVRRFHGLRGWPQWMWVFGGVVVVSPAAVGWVGRRVRERRDR